MKKGNVILLAFILVIALSAASGGFTSEGKDAHGSLHSLYVGILESLERKLILEKPLFESLSVQDAVPTAIIYVLGGGQDSLIPRFRKVSRSYDESLGKVILILSRPGIMESRSES
jgi:hypothetical protein